MANTKKSLKRLSGSSKLLIVVFSALLFLLLYIITIAYLQNLEQSKVGVFKKLKSIACTTVLLVDGDRHQHLFEKYKTKDAITFNEQDSNYLAIHKALKSVKELNELNTQIYTMVFNEPLDEFEFVVTSSETPYFRHMFINYPLELRRLDKSSGVIDTYKTENGTWLSAFAPIINKNNEVVAVLQVDEQFDSFIEEANQSLYKHIIITIVFFIPLSFFLFSYIRTSLKREEMHMQALEERNEEINTQNDLIQETNKKLERANEIISKKNQTLDIMVKERTKELLIANNDLETFLYRSSHDIKGPIATIRGLYNIASLDDKQDHTYLEMINKSILQLDTRVNSINSVFEVKKRDVVFKEIAIRPFLDNLLRDYCHSCAVEFAQNAPNIPERTTIKSDEFLLQIVFRELVKNSMDFKRKEPLIISLQQQLLGFNYIKLTYRDNGIGIEETVASTIFNMFTRGNEQSQGAGLGLYAVNLAIEKLHGKIKLIPSDQGAAFEIILPTR